MIVVDGDSVAVGEHEGKALDYSWPQLMAAGAGKPVKCLARHQSTAYDCLLRMPRALGYKPDWYVLQIGQWSQNHELMEDFERYTRQIIERARLAKVRVILVTPPWQLHAELDVWEVLSILRRLQRIYQVDLVDVHACFVDVGKQSEDDLRALYDGMGTVNCHLSFKGAVQVAEMFKCLR